MNYIRIPCNKQYKLTIFSRKTNKTVNFKTEIQKVASYVKKPEVQHSTKDYIMFTDTEGIVTSVYS